MAVKFLLKTGTANVVSSDELASSSVIEAKIGSSAVTEAKIGSGAVTEAKIGSGAVTEAKIGSGAVTGAKLASNIDLPSGTLLNGSSLSGMITAAAGGYDFKEAARTAVLLPSSAFVGSLQGGYNDSATVYTETNSPNIPAYGFVVSEASYALNTAIAANGNLALTSGDRVVFILTSDGSPTAGKPNGIFVASRVNGQGTTAGDFFWSFARATDADSVTDLSLGALVYFTSGDFQGEAAFLSAGEFNSSSALWTLQEATTYTAGSGISISGGNEISVVSDSGASLPVTVGVGGLSVRLATDSQSGGVSADQLKVIQASGANGKLDLASAAYMETDGAASITVGLPLGSGSSGVLPTYTTAFVEAVVVSRCRSLSGNADFTKRCVTKLAFTLSRGSSGNSALVGDVVTLYKEHDVNGIGGLAVDVLINTSTAGEDTIQITGVANYVIEHQLYVTARTVTIVP